jgi:gliding motility-associated-like protein
MTLRLLSFILWRTGARDCGLLLLLLFGTLRGEAQGALLLNTNTITATCGNANGSVVVTVTGGVAPYQFSINNGATFQSSDKFGNLAGGPYTVLVVDNTGTQETISFSIGNIPGPQVVVNPISASCLNNDGQLDVAASLGTPPYMYSAGGSYGSNNIIGGLASGAQTAFVMDANGCLASGTATIPLTDNLILTMGGGTTICQGTGTTLPASSNAATFAWSPAAGLSSVSAQDPVASPAATTTYSLVATLGVCAQTAPVTITVLPAPVADAGAPDTVCPGKSAQLQGSGGVQYAWSPPTYLSDPAIANPVVQQPERSITYSLTVVGVNGCSSIQPATVLVDVTPPPVVFAGDDTAVLVGQPVPLNGVDVNNIGFTTYQWSPPSGLNDPSVQDPVAQIEGNIIYSVTATTPGGCVGTGSIVIVVVPAADIVVPNAFTPNGDGHNDVLKVYAPGIRDFKYFEVFNRWGQQVFSTANAGIGWDGMIGGQLSPMGTYVWVALGLDFQGRAVQRKGTVILIR